MLNLSDDETKRHKILCGTVIASFPILFDVMSLIGSSGPFILFSSIAGIICHILTVIATIFMHQYLKDREFVDHDDDMGFANLWMNMIWTVHNIVRFTILIWGLTIISNGYGHEYIYLQTVQNENMLVITVSHAVRSIFS